MTIATAVPEQVTRAFVQYGLGDVEDQGDYADVFGVAIRVRAGRVMYDKDTQIENGTMIVGWTNDVDPEQVAGWRSMGITVPSNGMVLMSIGVIRSDEDLTQGVRETVSAIWRQQEVMRTAYALRQWGLAD